MIKSGLGGSVALSLSYWFGSLSFFFSAPVIGQALRHLDWWKYFQAYLLGRMENHVEVLVSNPSVSAVFKSLAKCRHRLVDESLRRTTSDLGYDRANELARK